MQYTKERYNKMAGRVVLLTSIHLYSLESVTSVRLTVGYHIPCKSAGDIGIEVVKFPPANYISQNYNTKIDFTNWTLSIQYSYTNIMPKQKTITKQLKKERILKQ